MTRPRVNETRAGHSMYLSDGVVVRGLRLLEYRKGCRGSFLHFAWCTRLIVETDNSAVITRSARSSEPDRSFHRYWERRGGWGLAAIGMQGKEIGASRSHVGCAAGVDAHTRCRSAPESVSDERDGRREKARIQKTHRQTDGFPGHNRKKRRLHTGERCFFIYGRNVGG